MTLEEAYRACAVERYSTDTLKADQHVQIVENGAWVDMKLFIPDWVLGMGYRVAAREGGFIMFSDADPDDFLIAETLDELFQQL